MNDFSTLSPVVLPPQSQTSERLEKGLDFNNVEHKGNLLRGRGGSIDKRVETRLMASYRERYFPCIDDGDLADYPAWELEINEERVGFEASVLLP